MKIILFRHAEKTNDGSANPKLSQRGEKQAQKLVSEVSAKKIPAPQILMVSPRLRTQQTFEHLARALKIKPAVTPLLDERVSGESKEDFRRRVQELLVLLQMDYQKEECIYLCTHYDWIEEFLSVVECTSDLSQLKYQQWNSGQWMWLNKADLWDVVKFDQIQP